MLSDEKLRELFCAVSTEEPLAGGWPNLERFARAIENEVLDAAALRCEAFGETLEKDDGTNYAEEIRALKGRVASSPERSPGTDFRP